MKRDEADDNDKLAGRWTPAVTIIDPTDYIVGVWYAGFAGMAIYAELVRKGETFELRVTGVTSSGDSTLLVLVSPYLGPSEAAAVAFFGGKFAEACEEHGKDHRLMIPVEYIPIGGDHLVCAEKLAGKPWIKLKAQGQA
jgi:hypothetical protein